MERSLEMQTPAGEGSPAAGGSDERPAGERMRLGGALLTMAALVAALVVVSRLVSIPWLLTLQNIIGLALFAVATNLLIGYTGLVSFGQAAFYGTGAYAVAIGWLHFKAPFWLGFVAAPLVGAAAALGVGLLALRARKLYFALLTLAFSQLFYVVAEQEYTVTNGANGIFGPMIPAALTDPYLGFYFVLAVGALCMLALWKITESPFGLTLRAIRENRERAEALGVNVFRHQLLAFVISGVFCAIAGVLFVVHDQSAYPELLDWTKSGDPVLMAVIGGMYAFLGPAAGALFYQLAHDFIVQQTRSWQLVLGLVLLAVVLFVPDGLSGLFARLGERLRGRRQPGRDRPRAAA